MNNIIKKVKLKLLHSAPFIPEKHFIEIKYYLIMGKKLNLDNPKTYNEKLQYLKLYDRNPKYTNLVDKYEVKKNIESKIGKEYLIPTLGIYDNFEDIDINSLPNQFVIKCTHDSGGLVICKDKKNLNIKEAEKKITKHLKHNYYWSGREWPYKNVKPKIIIEKYMKNGNSDELTDYKVMCFGGKAKMIFTCTERYSSGLKVTFFDNKWNRLPFERHYPSSNKPIEKPKNLNQMLLLSEKLSKGIPFVRIDWYEINGKLYFGEYTFYPGAGFEEFSPEEWDKKLGDMIDLSLVKKNEK